MRSRKKHSLIEANVHHSSQHCMCECHTLTGCFAAGLSGFASSGNYKCRMHCKVASARSSPQRSCDVLCTLILRRPASTTLARTVHFLATVASTEAGMSSAKTVAFAAHFPCCLGEELLHSLSPAGHTQMKSQMSLHRLGSTMPLGFQ